MKSGQTFDALFKNCGLYPPISYGIKQQGNYDCQKHGRGHGMGYPIFRQPPNLGLRLYVNASWQVDNIPDMTVEPDTVYMHVGCVSKHGVECVGRISEVVVDRQSLILEPWSSLDLAAHGNISGNFMLRHVLEQESKSQELNFRKETLCLCSCHCRVNEMVANGRHTFCQQ